MGKKELKKKMSYMQLLTENPEKPGQRGLIANIRDCLY